MPDRTEYRSGTPCWVDMATPDLEGVTDFYARLFGWQPVESPTSMGFYRVMHHRGHPAVGLHRMGDDRRAAGDRPAWLTYLATPDVDACAARIVARGGAIATGPYDVDGFGRAVAATDPTGGIFAAWQGREHPGAGVVGEPGAMVWNELTTADGAAAAAFLAEVFDLRVEDMGPGTGYTRLRDELGPVAGVRQLMGSPSVWTTWFGVEDTDLAVSRVAALGGEVTVPPLDTPFGRVAVVADPAGGAFALVEMIETAI